LYEESHVKRVYEQTPVSLTPNPGGVVLDIGANVGMFATRAAEALGDQVSDNWWCSMQGQVSILINLVNSIMSWGPVPHSRLLSLQWNRGNKLPLAWSITFNIIGIGVPRREPIALRLK